MLFVFYEIGLILRTALIDFERNSVHGKMHFVDAAVGQSSQQHGLGRKIEQPLIIATVSKSDERFTVKMPFSITAPRTSVFPETAAKPAQIRSRCKLLYAGV